MVEKIHDLIDEMWEELEDAEEYADKGMECNDPAYKSAYFAMAHDELHHFEKLGEMLKEHHNVGEEMKKYIDLSHASMLKKHAYIKFLISNAK